MQSFTESRERGEERDTFKHLIIDFIFLISLTVLLISLVISHLKTLHMLFILSILNYSLNVFLLSW